ncbi:MAG: ABC-F type ribosomal protection protein [Bacillota bacterium]|jgi:ATP-binding cassette subfamily F protein 3|nr:ABC-F type ribosomal protection protein [Bacillota bacterium]NLL26943.1 ABC-F type ribosomal protection protein [Erysipelotrichia bacterium]
MLLKIKNGCKDFGGEILFTDLDFEIKSNEKVAVIGRNGCGKTTLLKIINGDCKLDQGQLIIDNNISIGYLSQQAFEDENLTVRESFNEVYRHILDIEKELKKVAERLETEYSEELLAKFASLQHQFECHNGYNYDQQQIMLFTRFGFSIEDLDKKISEFSGGQRTRIGFVRLLLLQPDILLLDEPTNHLDIQTVEWLEGYLQKYPNAIVIVSHDRMFLDKVVSEIYEFEFNKLNHYIGNYSKFVEIKENEFQRQQIAYKNQQAEIDRLEKLIEKFRYKKNKAAFAQSKIKYLEKMTKVERPDKDKRKMKLRFEKNIKGGNTVLIVDQLEIGYDKPLCKIDLQVFSGHKLGVIGPNGLGKSTFLKTIMGLIPPLSGDFMYGHQIEVAYFDQTLAQVSSTKTVLDELWDLYPEYDHTQIRTVLGNFMFTADDVFKTCDVLSGGEKVRLLLCKIMLSKANLLILDEPTNHLDIAGKESLEKALLDYNGTVIFVSHDRYFVNKLANRILYIDGKKTNYYQLNYQEYLEKINNIEYSEKEETKEEKAFDSKTERENKKRAEALEKQITKAEEELENLRALRFEKDYYHDYRKMNELDDEIDDKKNEIIHLMKEWEDCVS